MEDSYGANGCVQASVHRASLYHFFGCADTLSDPTSRKLYNQYGLEGMKQHQGAQAGQGNARDAWDEFKPFKKENKRTKARAASQATASVDSDGAGASTSDDG